jgi:hypothetical protein
MNDPIRDIFGRDIAGLIYERVHNFYQAQVITEYESLLYCELPYVGVTLIQTYDPRFHAFTLF